MKWQIVSHAGSTAHRAMHFSIFVYLFHKEPMGKKCFHSTKFNAKGFFQRDQNYRPQNLGDLSWARCNKWYCNPGAQHILQTQYLTGREKKACSFWKYHFQKLLSHKFLLSKHCVPLKLYCSLMLSVHMGLCTSFHENMLGAELGTSCSWYKYVIKCLRSFCKLVELTKGLIAHAAHLFGVHSTI